MLKIKGINKSFKNFQLQDIHLEIGKGEYFMLLGKSGSGKSLLLEIIAGLQKPESGRILLHQQDITRMDIQKRDIGLLFQDYAIFPHLNVFENIAYPLKSKKISSKEKKNTVVSLAEEFEISHLLKRKTDKLSGGEKQRVALARTLAMEPEVLLLDEPLTSLDVQLRQGIRKLFRKINKKGQTIIHVTHDHEEAILLADKVAVINQGRIIQHGPVREVFHHPKNEFVASFTGIRNFFRAKFKKNTDAHLHEAITASGLSFKMVQKPQSGEGAIVIPCQHITLSENQTETSAVNNFQGKLLEILPSLNAYEVVVDIGIPLSVMISYVSLQNLNIKEGRDVWVSFKASAIEVLDY